MLPDPDSFTIMPRCPFISKLSLFPSPSRTHYPIRKLALLLDLRRQYMATYAEMMRRTRYFAEEPLKKKRSAAVYREDRGRAKPSDGKKGGGWPALFSGWFYKESGEAASGEWLLPTL